MILAELFVFSLSLPCPNTGSPLNFHVCLVFVSYFTTYVLDVAFPTTEARDQGLEDGFIFTIIFSGLSRSMGLLLALQADLGLYTNAFGVPNHRGPPYVPDEPGRTPKVQPEIRMRNSVQVLSACNISLGLLR